MKEPYMWVVEYFKSGEFQFGITHESRQSAREVREIDKPEDARNGYTTRIRKYVLESK